MNKVIPLIISIVMVIVGAILNDFTSAISTARAFMIIGSILAVLSTAYLVFKG